MLTSGVTPMPAPTRRCLSASAATSNRLRGWLISSTVPAWSSCSAAEPPRDPASRFTEMMYESALWAGLTSEYCRTRFVGPTTSMCAPGSYGSNGRPSSRVNRKDLMSEVSSMISETFTLNRLMIFPSAQVQPAVDVPAGAGDEGCVPARQQGDDLCDEVGRAEPAYRDGREVGLHPLRPDDAVHGRQVERTGGDRVDRDPRGRELPGEHLGQRVDAALRRRVVRTGGGAAVLAGQRAQVDDPPVAVVGQIGAQHLARVEGAGEVHPDDRAELLGADLHDRRGLGACRVVDDDV